jgi:HlyD family secretion protein
MTASLEILTDFKAGVLAVPLSAVASRAPEKEEETSNTTDKVKEDMTDAEKRREELAKQKQEVVFVLLSDNKVEMRKVKTGIADFELVEIASGLKEGEKIVTGPFSAITKTLNDGDEVRIKSKEKKKTKG